ncbi:MAG: hypothetical protein GY841_04580 [FCB group bacterium]|nr:hypothetical protein [FCB group bacterium]
MTDDVILESIKEDVGIIREVLLGNGDVKKSIVVRLTKLEDSVNNCQTRNKEYLTEAKTNKRLDRKSVASIICALIMSAGAIIVSLIT